MRPGRPVQRFNPLLMGILCLLVITNLGLALIRVNPASVRMKGKRESYPRVEQARRDSDHRLKLLFTRRHLQYPPAGIYLRIFKREERLELWAMTENRTYRLVKSYRFCTSSGMLGPKRRQGDLQIPEGCYVVNRFNPFSRFYLSLGIDYPNRSDRLRGDRINPGGDIFIHGSCVSIGCIPITDEKIKELYWAAEQAREQGQERIPVHIFPAKMDQINMNALGRLAIQPAFWSRLKSMIGGASHPHSAEQLIGFWKNLKTIYDYFEKYRKVPDIAINEPGDYLIKNTPPSG